MAVPVERWMSPDPVVIDAEASALAAYDLMVERGVRHLPVVDRKGGLVGVISIDDLRAAFPLDTSLRRPFAAPDRTLLADYALAEAMTHGPETVRPETPLEAAAERLAAQRIGCLPVVDASSRLVGILSETDALRALVVILRGSEADAALASGRAEEAAFVESLRRERDHLAADLARLSDEERALASDLHEEVRDDVDRASDQREIDRDDALAERAARRLDALQRALERAAGNRLTRCERCGGSIALARLRAVPDTALCIACARAEERARGTSAKRG